MKLKYWIAENLTDSQCYNIRGKTKKEVKTKLSQEVNHISNHYTNDYGPIHKVVIEYTDNFDLMMQCMQEGSLDESGT